MKQRLKHLLRRINSYRHSDSIVLAIGLVIYTALVLSTISYWSIWFDEAFSAYIVRFNVVEIAHYTAVDVHPPMYYWVLKGWTSLFGTTELAFRSLSLMFGAVAISFGFLIVKRLFNRKAAWISLLLLVISPMLIRYGQEARMYTMAAAIVMAATYTLIIAEKSKRRLPWVVYGILVALGMWTHYFVAVAWIAHWLWRALSQWQKKYRGIQYVRHFFTKQWVGAHVLAVALFIPWLPFMVTQLLDIQTGWFWISPVSADSLTSYLTTVIFFTQHDKTSPWIGILFFVVVSIIVSLAVVSYRKLDDKNRRSFLLIASMAITPVLLVFIASLPPLHSSFLERYLMPAVVSFSLFTGMVIAVGSSRFKPIVQTIIITIVAGSLLIGVNEAQTIGNFNKNSNVSIKTKDVIAEIAARGSVGEPIIARSPWLFYEAVFYESTNHPVYYLESTIAGSQSGSLDMLQGNDSHKIQSLQSFGNQHSKVWYFGELGDSEIPAPHPGWVKVQTFRIDDPVTGNKRYEAAEFTTGS